MPNTPRPRKVKKLLKKLAKDKSADKFLEELSEKKFKPGTSEPNKTPQTDVMGRPLKSSETSKKGEPQSQKKGTPAMADSEGNPMTRGQQRRAIRRVRKAETKAEKARKKAKKKAEKEKRRASRPNRTPQTDVIGRRIG